MSGLTGLNAAWFEVYRNAVEDMSAWAHARGDRFGIAIGTDRHSLEFQVAAYRAARADAALGGCGWISGEYRALHRKAKAALAEAKQ